MKYEKKLYTCKFQRQWEGKEEDNEKGESENKKSENIVRKEQEEEGTRKGMQQFVNYQHCALCIFVRWSQSILSNLQYNVTEKAFINVG